MANYKHLIFLFIFTGTNSLNRDPFGSPLHFIFTLLSVSFHVNYSSSAQCALVVWLNFNISAIMFHENSNFFRSRALKVCHCLETVIRSKA